MPTLTITTDQTDILDDTIAYKYTVIAAEGEKAIRDVSSGKDFLRVVTATGAEHCIRTIDIHKVTVE